MTGHDALAGGGTLDLHVRRHSVDARFTLPLRNLLEVPDSLDDDIRRCRIARRAVGDEIKLMVTD